jgi:hypothetical protein
MSGLHYIESHGLAITHMFGAPMAKEAIQLRGHLIQ